MRRVFAIASFLALAASGYGQETPRDPVINVAVKDADLRAVLADVSRRAGAKVTLDAGIVKKVSITLSNVEWKNAVALICEQSGCALVASGSEWVVRQATGLAPKDDAPWRTLEASPRGKAVIDLTVEAAQVRDVLDEVGRRAGIDIFVAPVVSESLTLSRGSSPGATSSRRSRSKRAARSTRVTARSCSGRPRARSRPTTLVPGARPIRTGRSTSRSRKPISAT